MPVAQTPRLAEIHALARCLLDAIEVGASHEIALEALLTAYFSVAVCHPYCAHRSAAFAREVAARIETEVAFAVAGAQHLH